MLTKCHEADKPSAVLKKKSPLRLRSSSPPSNGFILLSSWEGTPCVLLSQAQSGLGAEHLERPVSSKALGETRPPLPWGLQAPGAQEPLSLLTALGWHGVCLFKITSPRLHPCNAQPFTSRLAFSGLRGPLFNLDCF